MAPKKKDTVEIIDQARRQLATAAEKVDAGLTGAIVDMADSAKAGSSAKERNIARTGFEVWDAGLTWMLEEIRLFQAGDPDSIFTKKDMFEAARAGKDAITVFANIIKREQAEVVKTERTALLRQAIKDLHPRKATEKDLEIIDELLQ